MYTTSSYSQPGVASSERYDQLAALVEAGSLVGFSSDGQQLDVYWDGQPDHALIESWIQGMLNDAG